MPTLKAERCWRTSDPLDPLTPRMPRSPLFPWKPRSLIPTDAHRTRGAMLAVRSRNAHPSWNAGRSRIPSIAFRTGLNCSSWGSGWPLCSWFSFVTSGPILARPLSPFGPLGPLSGGQHSQKLKGRSETQLAGWSRPKENHCAVARSLYPCCVERCFCDTGYSTRQEHSLAASSARSKGRGAMGKHANVQPMYDPIMQSPEVVISATVLSGWTPEIPEKNSSASRTWMGTKTYEV
ncbi:hypothetical protein EYF80_009388 [Liparis tanakae]|uniref:Uncharacterized protein n=1 Tax=Liparis tanakae TaxID=230148 RepID=A0A4Z2IS72_9TELE|nr:hypothetical protein EYF80_009388 [Liparis tanakae]